VKSAALRLILGLWLACSAALAGAEVAVPALKTRVTDLTATLQASQTAALEQQLAALEIQKGSQVAILIVPTTQPETVEQYALRVAEAWKLGRKGIDDGALLLVAKNDRKLRIEVGYGLEGAIPDAVAKRIISETITPQFKQQRFFEGLNAGVKQIAALLGGEQLPPPSVSTRQSASGDGGGWWIFLFFLAMAGARVLRAVFGQFIGAAIVGTAVGVAAGLITATLLIGVVAAFAGFLIALASASGSTGWSSGGGGGWSSGGSSDSGFSGGGGDFGGGGASGDW